MWNLDIKALVFNTVKPVLSGHSKDQKLIFKTDYRLMQVKKYCRMLPLGAFCSTFDLH